MNSIILILTKSISLKRFFFLSHLKADTIYSAWNNEIEKHDGVKSLSEFGSDRASVIIEHKNNASKLKG